MVLSAGETADNLAAYLKAALTFIAVSKSSWLSMISSKLGGMATI